MNLLRFCSVGLALAALPLCFASTPLEDAYAWLARGPTGEPAQAKILAELRQLAAGHDPAAAEAGYILARLQQLHVRAPDPLRAAEEFRRLAERHPENYWAQLGLVKLALITLFDLPATTPEARFIAATGLLPKVQDLALRRDLHLVLGRAGIVYHRPSSEILAHLLAADGGLDGDELWRGDLQVQIAELSLRVGQAATAKQYFERFLRHNEFDPRAFAVREKLAQLAREGGTPVK